MLELKIESEEAWDEELEIFVSGPSATLILEHTLLSLSKWEEKWRVPFLGPQPKTEEQILDYIKTMNSAPDVPPEVFNFLTEDHYQQIQKYMTENPTGTTLPVSVKKRTGTREIVSAELIYYWMTALNIPFSCETWHLERLLILIQVANIKQSPPKKKSASQIAAEHRQLNAQRRAQYGTNG